MIKQHDVYMFTRELMKLKSEYQEATSDNLKACIQADIIFYEDILTHDQLPVE
ncbi:hypothetical protein [Alkalicoccobacillus plakortidis]|uniref:Uncharacterized protein n=1 Tax=Alkalicoccobacillus plakortidis TaxID=444060 RepID=A0ABT0XHP5_9BACI|nr:hypothetical protein [Alkalicoccobacillus plakortidis]MCM2675431.1 hypothetical protein [Alkalicoccobacillus plakortidis]